MSSGSGGCRIERTFEGQEARILRARGDRTFRRISAVAKVRVSPHALRHSFAQLVLNAGTPLPEVSALLHHSNIATTNVYVRRLVKPSTTYWRAIEAVINPRKRAS